MSLRRSATALAVLAVLAACSGGALPFAPGANAPAPGVHESPSPPPGALLVNPAALSIIGLGTSYTQTATVTETGYSGTISVTTNTCASNGLADVTLGGSTVPLTATVTGAAAGACAIIFADTNNHTTTLSITVTTAGVVVH